MVIHRMHAQLDPASGEYLVKNDLRPAGVIGIGDDNSRFHVLPLHGIQNGIRLARGAAHDIFRHDDITDRHPHSGQLAGLDFVWVDRAFLRAWCGGLAQPGIRENHSVRNTLFI